MSLLGRLKGHRSNSAGVCYRCGGRCEHRNRHRTEPCAER